MNADKINMAAGSAIAALLVFLLLGFFRDQIFHSGDHHGEDEALAFAVEVADADAGKNPDADVGVDYASLVANADLAAGEKLFKKCTACHKVADGANGVGPHLWRVVGRPIAAVRGFGYSPALTGKEGAWDLEALSAFIENPKRWAPGTKMSYGGMKKPADRVNLIAWLNEVGGAPVALAEAPANVAAEATEVAAVEPETTQAEATAAETGENSDASDPASGGAWSALLANANAKKGRRIFRKCRACHKLEEGKNSIGPSLYGVIHRDIASVDGFGYSDALAAKEGKWTLDELMGFIQAPQSWAPGTKMTFAGLKDAQDRIDVIVFLNEADGSPEALE